MIQYCNSADGFTIRVVPASSQSNLGLCVDHRKSNTISSVILLLYGVCEVQNLVWVQPLSRSCRISILQRIFWGHDLLCCSSSLSQVSYSLNWKSSTRQVTLKGSGLHIYPFQFDRHSYLIGTDPETFIVCCSFVQKNRLFKCPLSLGPLGSFGCNSIIALESTIVIFIRVWLEFGEYSTVIATELCWAHGGDVASYINNSFEATTMTPGVIVRCTSFAKFSLHAEGIDPASVDSRVRRCNLRNPWFLCIGPSSPKDSSPPYKIRRAGHALTKTSTFLCNPYRVLGYCCPAWPLIKSPFSPLVILGEHTRTYHLFLLDRVRIHCTVPTPRSTPSTARRVFKEFVFN